MAAVSAGDSTLAVKGASDWFRLGVEGVVRGEACGWMGAGDYLIQHL